MHWSYKLCQLVRREYISKMEVRRFGPLRLKDRSYRHFAFLASTMSRVSHFFELKIDNMIKDRTAR